MIMDTPGIRSEIDLSHYDSPPRAEVALGKKL